MSIERFDFPNASGLRLAAALDRPSGQLAASALFAHCFTCAKDNLAASRIAHTLADHGIAVLRFDFSGIGASEGEFANAGFSAMLPILSCRRPFAADPYGTSTLDRAQPRRRCGVSD
jgi:hypothetical protein